MLPAPSAPRSSATVTAAAKFLRAIVVEQGQEPDRVMPQRLAAGGQSLQQRRDGRHREAQAVPAGVDVGLTGRGHEALDVRRLLDGLAGVIAPGMARQFLRPVDEADGGGARQQRQRAADVRVGNRVAIAVEAHVGELPRNDRAHQRRSQTDGPATAAGAAARPRRPRHGAVPLLGMGALVRQLVAPAPELRIEIVDILKRARGKEGIAEVAGSAARFCPSHFRVPACRAAAAKW